MLLTRDLGPTGKRVSDGYYHPELFAALDNLVKEGKLLN